MRWHWLYAIPNIYFSIYKWTGTYFDTAEEILTQGATSVTSFTKDEDEIIIITQNLYNTQQV